MVEEDENLARELASSQNDSPGAQPPSKPPSQPPQKAGRGSGRWVFFSFFLLTILVVVLAIVALWTPVSKTLLALLVTPTPMPATPSASTIVQASASPLQGDTPTSKNTPTLTKPSSLPLLPSITPTLTRTKTPSQLFLPSITPTFTATSGPTFTPLGAGYSQIAFASNQTGAPQIYIVNTDNSDLQQVTNMPAGACQPDWSPDGLHIAFISPCTARQDEYPGAKLYVINADGSGLVELPSSNAGDFDPAWSPDGKHIAFTSLRDGLDQIYVMELPDYTVTQLTEKTTDVRFPDWSRQPAWSPDGTQIAYSGHNRLVSAQQIWVMSAAGHNQALLTPRGLTYWDFLPTWSPNGKTILFNETSGPQSLGWLMLFDYEHRQNAQATHLRAGTNGNHARYSIDGLWVVYENIDIFDLKDIGYYIFMMKNASGNAPIQIQTNASLNFGPVWRPKGSP